MCCRMNTHHRETSSVTGGVCVPVKVYESTDIYSNVSYSMKELNVMCEMPKNVNVHSNLSAVVPSGIWRYPSTHIVFVSTCTHKPSVFIWRQETSGCALALSLPLSLSLSHTQTHTHTHTHTCTRNRYLRVWGHFPCGLSAVELCNCKACKKNLQDLLYVETWLAQVEWGWDQLVWGSYWSVGQNLAKKKEKEEKEKPLSFVTP